MATTVEQEVHMGMEHHSRQVYMKIGTINTSWRAGTFLSSKIFPA